LIRGQAAAPGVGREVQIARLGQSDLRPIGIDGEFFADAPKKGEAVLRKPDVDFGRELLAD
jgi:hypothetical protein